MNCRIARWVLACALAIGVTTLHAETMQECVNKAVASGSMTSVQACASAGAPSGAASRPSAYPGGNAATWLVGLSLVLMTVSFGIVARGLYQRKQIPGERDWRFADALSEEVTLTNADGQPTLVLVASASRLIAVFGMVVILSLYLTFGLALLWDLSATGTAPSSLDGVMKFLIGGGSLFAPYLFNQIRAGLERKPVPPSSDPAAATHGSNVQLPAVLPGAKV